MDNMENIPVFKNPAELIKFSEKLRKENNGELAEAFLIYDAGRFQILHKMKLNESGFQMSFEEDLTPKKQLKYVKNKETGKMELDFG